MSLLIRDATIFHPCAWAASMRSKGSLCGPGRSPARIPCSTDMGSCSKRSRIRNPAKSAARSSAPGSSTKRPRPTFRRGSSAYGGRTHSQRPISCSDRHQKEFSDRQPEKRTIKQAQEHMPAVIGGSLTLPTFQFRSRRQRLEKLLIDAQLAL